MENDSFLNKFFHVFVNVHCTIFNMYEVAICFCRDTMTETLFNITRSYNSIRISVISSFANPFSIIRWQNSDSSLSRTLLRCRKCSMEGSNSPITGLCEAKPVSTCLIVLSLISTSRTVNKQCQTSVKQKLICHFFLAWTVLRGIPIYSNRLNL